MPEQDHVLHRGTGLRLNNDVCPQCGTSLQGKPIPAHEQEMFGATHFSRKIGIYSREVDRTVAWRCPDCGHEWPRNLPTTKGRFY